LYAGKPDLFQEEFSGYTKINTSLAIIFKIRPFYGVDMYGLGFKNDKIRICTIKIGLAVM